MADSGAWGGGTSLNRQRGTPPGLADVTAHHARILTSLLRRQRRRARAGTCQPAPLRMMPFGATALDVGHPPPTKVCPMPHDPSGLSWPACHRRRGRAAGRPARAGCCPGHRRALCRQHAAGAGCRRLRRPELRGGWRDLLGPGSARLLGTQAARRTVRRCRARFAQAAGCREQREGRCDELGRVGRRSFLAAVSLRRTATQSIEGVACAPIRIAECRFQVPARRRR